MVTIFVVLRNALSKKGEDSKDTLKVIASL